MSQAALLIFDLDGTLFHTEKVSIPAVQGALRAAGYAEPTPETIIGFFGRPYQEFFAWLNATYPGIPPEVAASIDAWELELVRERGALYPGVQEALAELRPAVSYLAICSNGPRPYVEAVVEHHDLAPFFDAVRWRTEEDANKAAMVRGLLAQFACPFGAVIGDRRDDVEAAHENGLVAIASGYGYGDEQELARADAVAQSPADLPRLVRALLDSRA
jgi:phosphoglycolate phosphatase